MPPIATKSLHRGNAGATEPFEILEQNNKC